MTCEHADRDPVMTADHQLVSQVCRGCGEEWPVDLSVILVREPTPEMEAQARAYVDSLPDVTGEFAGRIATEDDFVLSMMEPQGYENPN